MSVWNGLERKMVYARTAVRRQERKNAFYPGMHGCRSNQMELRASKLKLPMLFSAFTFGQGDLFWETLHPSCQHVLHFSYVQTGLEDATEAAEIPILSIREAESTGGTCSVPPPLSTTASNKLTFRSNSNHLEVDLSASENDFTAQIEYGGVDRDPDCSVGYISASFNGQRRRCIGRSSPSSNVCPQGRGTFQVETAEEMELIKKMLDRG
jgi:hypothetical protein